MKSLRVVVLGLSLSSSWGNGHASTYRALLRGMATRGHEILFLERNVPWYIDHRDMMTPDFCDLAFYNSVDELALRWRVQIEAADAVIVGSYVPDGVNVLDLVLHVARGTRVFYDIDTPITLAALTIGNAAYLEHRQIPELDLYLSFSGGRAVERLHREFRARAAHALYCSVDPLTYKPISTPKCWDLGYLGTYSSDRQPCLQELLIKTAIMLPGMRFVVAGPQYPDTLDWPANVDRIVHLSPDRHAEFYSRQRFTLNVTRSDMVSTGWSPSVRLFEAAACGTPLISDGWDGLADLLPENIAILIASESSKVREWISDPDYARHLSRAENARRLVLDAHTGVERARELELLLTDATTRRSTTEEGRYCRPDP